MSGVALEASEIERIERAAEALPSAETLIALARRRLDRELSALPTPGSPAWRAALLADGSYAGSGGAGGVSFGALAHAVRVAARAGRMAEAQEFFVALLRRIDGLNRRWVTTTLWSLPSAAEERRERAQDLAQELTLLLWEQIGQREDDAWELFFQRALAYAQGHVATTYLRREGLRADPRAQRPARGQAVVFSRLPSTADALDDEGEIAGATAVEAPAFTRAELADLRALVERLPARQRLAVVMRFWQRASEREIALALGGVSTRAVRYMLRRAYSRLRAEYTGDTGAEALTHQREEADVDAEP